MLCHHHIPLLQRRGRDCLISNWSTLQSGTSSPQAHKDCMIYQSLELSHWELLQNHYTPCPYSVHHVSVIAVNIEILSWYLCVMLMNASTFTVLALLKDNMNGGINNKCYVELQPLVVQMSITETNKEKKAFPAGFHTHSNKTFVWKTYFFLLTQKKKLSWKKIHVWEKKNSLLYGFRRFFPVMKVFSIFCTPLPDFEADNTELVDLLSLWSHMKHIVTTDCTYLYWCFTGLTQCRRHVA